MSSRPLDIGVKAYELFHDTNLVDGSLFPNTRKLERETVRWVGRLLRNPNPDGSLTSGGTESNLMALWIARKRNPAAKKVLVPESAHYSIRRACELMTLETVSVPLDARFKADVSIIREELSEEVLACVLSAGTTEMGVVDPISEVSLICRERDVFLHVDAAYGGFVLPFLRRCGFPAPDFDFANKGVQTVTVDPHKMGLAPIPAGMLVTRKGLLQKIAYKPEYLQNPTSTVLGTRPGGPAAAVWALTKSLGVGGYTRIVGECMRNALLLYDEIISMEGIEPIVMPELPIVCFRVGRNAETAYRRLSMRGWRLTFNSRLGFFRVVVMPHTRTPHILAFLEDLKEVV